MQCVSLSYRARAGFLGNAATVSLAACLLGACGGERPGEPIPPRRPDVVLVSVESLRPDHLGCYGYGRPTSPTIDRLAGEGVRFAQAISTTSWTLPAHAAMFTGLNDSAHGAVDHTLQLAEEHVTLAEVLRDAGYRTAGFYGGPFLHPVFGLGQGFEAYENCMSALAEDAPEREVRRQSAVRDSAAHGDVTGPRTLERFESWLATLDDRPIFAFLHLWDPHYDYIPPRPYAEMFDPDYEGSVDARDYPNNRQVRAGMPRRDLEHVIALYDGEIRFTDEILGRILESLGRRRRGNDALIVVTSDHGQEFFEHGGKGHHRTLYDEVIKVPLIFNWPGRLPAGAVVEEQVRLIDVMPTILSLAEIPAPGNLQGRDLSPLLFGTDWLGESAHSELLSLGKQFRSQRTNRMKVLVDDQHGIEVHHDLLADPGELRPSQEMTQEARKLLEELRATQRSSAALHDEIVASAPEPTRMPEEIEERLRSLGYVGGEEDP